MAFEDGIDNRRHDEHTASHEEHCKYDRNAVNGVSECCGDNDKACANTGEQCPDARTRQRAAGDFDFRRMCCVFPPTNAADEDEHAENGGDNRRRKPLKTVDFDGFDSGQNVRVARICFLQAGINLVLRHILCEETARNHLGKE